jgi:hypothetical protein
VAQLVLAIGESCEFSQNQDAENSEGEVPALPKY